MQGFLISMISGRIKGEKFKKDIITIAVNLNYREISEIMTDWGVDVCHTTVVRCKNIVKLSICQESHCRWFLTNRWNLYERERTAILTDIAKQCHTLPLRSLGSPDIK